MDSGQTATVAMVRAMVAMGLADGEIGTSERTTIKQVYRMASGADLEDEVIDLVARDMSTNAYKPREVMAMSAEDLDDVKKRRVIQSAYFVMTADAQVSEKEAACLLALAEGLGMDQSGFDRAIEELEEMVDEAPDSDTDGAGGEPAGHKGVDHKGADDHASDDHVADYNGAAGPSVDPAEIFLNAMFRAMVAMAVCDGPMTPEERQTVKHLFEQVEQSIDDQMIDGIVLALQEYDGSIGDILARDAPAIDPSMKPRILQSVYFVMLASDEITEEESQTLLEIARGLGLSQAALEDALAAVRDMLTDS